MKTSCHYPAALWALSLAVVALACGCVDLQPDTGVSPAQATRLKPGGIGAMLSTNQGPFVVLQVPAEMPAAKAGLHPGETIVEIDGKSTVGMAWEEGLLRFRGDPGTKVVVTVQDAASNQRKLTLVRASLPRVTLEDRERNCEKAVVDFKERAKARGEMPSKPSLPREVDRLRILAENAVQEHRMHDAFNYFREGIAAAQGFWPDGQYNAALIAADFAEQGVGSPASGAQDSPEMQVLIASQKRAAFWFLLAMEHMSYYLVLEPRSPNADALRAKIIIWEERIRLLKRKFGTIYEDE